MAVVLGTALAASVPRRARTPAKSLPRRSTILAAIARHAGATHGCPKDQWNDCTQEVLCRLLKTLPARSWSQALAQETEERREFVRAIDAVKKRQQRGRWQNAAAPELVPDVGTTRFVTGTTSESATQCRRARA